MYIEAQVCTSFSKCFVIPRKSTWRLFVCGPDTTHTYKVRSPSFPWGALETSCNFRYLEGSLRIGHVPTRLGKAVCGWKNCHSSCFCLSKLPCRIPPSPVSPLRTIPRWVDHRSQRLNYCIIGWKEDWVCFCFCAIKVDKASRSCYLGGLVAARLGFVKVFFFFYMSSKANELLQAE